MGAEHAEGVQPAPPQDLSQTAIAAPPVPTWRRAWVQLQGPLVWA